MESGEKEKQNLPLLSKLFLFLVLVIVITSAFAAAGPVNEFFEGVLGEELQTMLEAPLAEEFLKALPLAALIMISNRAGGASFLESILPGAEKLEFLESMKRVYLIGIFSGIVFGFLRKLACLWFLFGL